MGGGLEARRRRERQRSARETNRRLRTGIQASGRRGASRLPGRNPIRLRRATSLARQGRNMLTMMEAAGRSINSGPDADRARLLLLRARGLRQNQFVPRRNPRRRAGRF